MKFYNREIELEQLRQIELLSHEASQMTVLTGRRRIGKTKLLLNAVQDNPSVYLFVSRKSESILSQQFAEEASRALNIPIGNYDSVSALLEHLMRISQTQPFSLIIDEFQELSRVDPGAYSSLQRDWDMMKGDMKLNLVVSGSVNRLMNNEFSRKMTSTIFLYVNALALISSSTYQATPPVNE